MSKLETLAGVAFAFARSKPTMAGPPAVASAAVTAWRSTVLATADTLKLSGTTRAWFLRASRW